ncbi:MAG: hypothetical protein AAF432_13535 [Planctomycetota bacterium]
MTWIRDVDLARMDASLFLDATTLPTTLVNVDDANIAGTSLTSDTASFIAVDVQPGYIVCTSVMVLEVVEVLSDTELRVSRLRCEDLADLRPAPPQTMGKARIATFERTITDVEYALFERLGVDATTTNRPESLRRLLTLEALARMFEAEGANRWSAESLTTRGRYYRTLATEAAALIQEDEPVRNRPGVSQLRRR